MTGLSSTGAGVTGTGRDPEEGTSLIELVVAMALIALFSAIFLVAIGQLNPAVRKQQGLADSMDSARRAFTLLDQEVRYADAINDPATVGTTQYVEYRWYRASPAGQTVRCSQWSVDSGSGVLREREWVASAGWTTSTPWVTVTSAVLGAAATPVFTTPGTAVPALPTATLFTQPLTVDLTVRSDKGRAATRVTLAAGNTTSGAPPAAPVCDAPTSRTP